MTALVGDGGMSKAMEVTGVGREEDQSSKAMILGRGRLVGEIRAEEMGWSR